MYLTNKELNVINGGASTSALLSALARITTTFYNIGYQVGSTVRRVISRNLCR